MSFDFRTLCAIEPHRPAHRVAAVLMPLGAAAAALPWTPPWAALLAGATLALTLGNPCADAAARASKWLLQLAVVGLGAGVNLAVVARVGGQGLGYTFAGLAVTFALGAWLAARIGVGPKIAALICAGTGICGGSAIAAASPAIDARAEETSAALAVVFLLNGVALLVFPAIGTWANLDAHQFARALWIVPVALGLGAWFRRSAGPAAPRARVPVPWFIAGFIAVSALFTFVPMLHPAARAVSLVARALLTLTLFLIGAGLSRPVARTIGARPLILALLLWIAMAGASLAAIRAGWIH